MSRPSIHRLIRRYVLTGSVRKQKTDSREYVSRPVFVDRLQSELGSTTIPFYRPATHRRQRVGEAPWDVAKRLASDVGWTTSPQSADQLRYEWTKLHTGHSWDTPWWAFWR